MAVMLAGAAHAQTTAGAAGDAAQAEQQPAQIVISGKRGNSIGVADAASQGSVSADEIALRPALRTAEILEFVPGLVVVQHSAGGKANQYFLRGFNLDHGTEFATFVDGVPVNMRTHAHGQGYTDLNFLIPELVERVDYRKGPYHAEEGDFASVGAARMRLFDRLPDARAAVSLGDHGYGRALLTGPLTPSGSVYYGLELGASDGAFDNPDRARKVNAVLRHVSGSRDDGYSLTAMVYAARWHATDQIPQRAVNAGLIGRLGAIDPSDGGQTARQSLNYALQQPNFDGNGALSLNAYVVHSSLDLYSNLTYFTDDPVNGDQFVQRERRTMSGLSLTQRWGTAWRGLEMLNRIGLQARLDRLAPVTLENTVERRAIGVIRSDKVREDSVGVFAENTTQWAAKFRSVLGVRADAYRFDVDSNLPANSGNRRAQIVSPKLALIFGPWSKTEYFASAGTGFHSNDARGTTATLNPRTFEAVERATPLVRSRGAEVGVRSELIPQLQTSLSLWRLNIGSELLFSGDVGETVASRPSTRHGLEWSNQLQVAPWLLVEADLALSHTRFADDDPAGNKVPGAIAKVASLGLTVPNLSGWSGNVHLRYFGPRVLIEDDSVRSSSSAIVNARVGYAFSPRTQLAFDVFNLFNRKATDSDYYYASKLRSETVPVGDVVFHPSEPRTLRLTLTHKF